MEPMEACTTGQTLTVKGKSGTVRFSNVLVGEVWLCSGQSNMFFPLSIGVPPKSFAPTAAAQMSYCR